MNSSPFDKNKRDEIVSNIKEAITKTKEDIERFKEMTQPIAPDDAIGRISRMDAINNKSVVDASLRKSQNKLKQLQFMLQNSSDPEFGLCASCKKQIPIGRILLIPESRFCVNCAR